MPSSITSAARRQQRAARRSSPWGMFFREFIKHPVMVGAILPSSEATIRKVLARVDWANTKVFVEYGPGIGNFCQPVLDRLPADAQLIAIDTNPDFVAHLRETIRDPRFSVVQGSAADVARILADHGHEQADYVLSGLPFSTLPPGVGRQISVATYDVLRPGGMFLVYQYNPGVRRFFGPVFDRIDRGFEIWNVPPQQIFWAHKDVLAQPAD